MNKSDCIILKFIDSVTSSGSFLQKTALLFPTDQNFT